MPNIYSIYKITNILENKIYIGFTQYPRKRWLAHLQTAAVN